MKWTSNDIADLRQLYPLASWAQIDARFPNASHNAIRDVASRFEIKRERVEVEIREPWRTPEVVQRLYQLLVIADDAAMRLNQSYDRINAINTAMELIREGK